MKGKVSCSIFVRILVATLVPLFLVLSGVFYIVAKSTFQTHKEAAQETILAVMQQSAEQVRSSLLMSSRLVKLAARGLAPLADDSDRARRGALEFIEHIFVNAPNVFRLWMYFEPGEDGFGTDESFAYEFYSENGELVRRPLAVDPESGLDLSLSQYAVPLKEGVSYHHSIAAQEHSGLDESVAYIASTNYPVVRDGKVIGGVGMELLYRRSFPLLDQWQAGGSHRLLIREGGTILYAADTSLIGRKIDSLDFEPDVLENMKNAMRQATPFVEEGLSPVSGEESLICVYPLDLSPQLSRLFLYMGTPTEIVYSGARASVWTMFLTFMTGILLFTGSLFAVTRNIVKPIKRLTRSADLIANGKLRGVLDRFDESRETRDEVYRLGCSLQKMLRELLKNLELKRTALRAANEKEKMKEAAAAKNRFFANMSHEIRTPMHVILGTSEILLKEKLTNDQKQFVQDIKVSSESLLNIINDILDLSRLESGKLSLLSVHYDFAVLIENIFSLGKYLAGKKGLEFRVETIGKTPEYLYGDDGRLRQVLLNVIGNAIKFTEKGSVTLVIVDEGETLRFDIIDTGIGIREEDRRYLFEPFKQIDSPHIRGARGTGLGLSICLNLVELMGGTISLESDYGKGSSFHITIPKVLGDGSKIENKVEALFFSFDSRARVLVVDDAESNLKVAREFLKMFGITAETASSGKEAIAMAARSEYDLIFMDHMMPEMDGVETTHRIRALGERHGRIPIIALTANAVIGTRELLLASGINDFLSKPIEMIKFQAILARWLPRNLLIRENHAALAHDLASGSIQGAGGADVMKGSEGKTSGLSSATHVLASVSQVKDLDISLGLSRVAGNAELYIDLLGMIVEMIPRTLRKVDKALSAGDASSVDIEMHTLKGSLANLGAVDLADTAAELEQLGKRGDLVQFAEKLGAFRRNLGVFAALLREKLSPGKDETQSEPSGTRQQLDDAVHELRTALAGFDYGESMKIITGLARFDWGEDYNLGIKTVCRHIRHFDYDTAMSELHRVFPRTQ